MSNRPGIVLAAALRLLRPLVRLLLREGVAYPAFAAALKPVFLEAARAELAARGMAATDSALTLLSGVHRRDVRRLARGAPEPGPLAAPLSLAAEVAGRWLGEATWLDADGRPRVLPRSGAGSFDALVESLSSDVRPRAMLDEMLRLGVVRETPEGIALDAAGLAPRAGFDEMAALMAANLQDHLAAAAANLVGESNFLEQALFVDQLGADSARQLERAASAAWQQALRQLMPLARARFEADAALDPAQRVHRARFGVYFFSDREDRR
ncbi:MAG: DUF6502 family protein [Rubrivivax sp.]